MGAIGQWSARNLVQPVGAEPNEPPAVKSAVTSRKPVKGVESNPAWKLAIGLASVTVPVMVGSEVTPSVLV